MSELRWIWIDGPPLLQSDGSEKIKSGLPLWSLQVGAAYFDRDNAADYAHPLRTLMIDARTTSVSVEGNSPFFQTGKPQHPLRAPRLIDVHLIAGAGKKPYRPNGNSETLQVNFYSEGNKIGGELRNRDADKPDFSTVGGHHEGDAPDAQEGFVHVVAEPQPILEKQNGDFIDQAGHTGKDSEKAIRVPRLRLLHGAIKLKIDGPLPWLGNIDPHKALPGASKSFELLLTPSGIEIVTAADFPGSADRLKGVFLIAPRNLRETARDQMTGEDSKSKFKLSALTLTLLPQETSQLTAVEGGTPVSLWMKAWRNAADPVLPPDDKNRCGIDIRALPSDLPPRFGWPLYLKKDPGPAVALVAATAAAADPPLAVDTPTNRLRIELRGSKGSDGTHEGAAALLTSRLRIATRPAAKALANELHRQNYLDKPEVPEASGGTVIVAEARPERSDGRESAKTPPPRYWTVSEIVATDSVKMMLKIVSGSGGGPAATIPLAYDEHRLAAALRTAVGWEEPQRRKLDGNGPGQPPFTQVHRPIVSGFVPLDRGWLQLPFPNLPPLDLEKDTSLLGALNPTPPSVLDGFIRIAQRPAVSFVSGYQSTPGAPVGETAPWSVTVEGAGVAVVMAAVVVAAEVPTLLQTRVVLREPDLAARGLMWFSADRPSELEALPRLGAGPGSFFDLDLTTTPVPDPETRVVTASLGALTLEYDSKGKVGRNDLNISLSFNPAAVDWEKGLAGTDGGLRALAQAREILLGKPVTAVATVDLAKLRADLADAESKLAAVEADFAAVEERRLGLAAELAEAAARQAAFEARRTVLTTQQAKSRMELEQAKVAGEAGRILEANVNLFAIEGEQAVLEKSFAGNADRLATLKAEKARLDGDSNVRGEILRGARKQVEIAGVALAKSDGFGLFKNPLPWPAVAWLRHPELPLAAGMPMTRAAASAVAPLESREFAPFVAAPAVAGHMINLVALSWKGTQAFPDLGVAPVFNRLAVGWPRPDAPINDGAGHGSTEGVFGPTEGVPFTAFGVPGTEIVPSIAAAQWDALEFAVRYDLPSLDEAFATAGLPPVADALPQEDEREKAADRPTATALDWPLMKDFWDDQERRRNLSLVLDSYLGNFEPAVVSPASLKVRTLIRGATWTIDATFDANHLESGLPYGAVKFGKDDLNSPAFTANTALKGLSGKISFKSEKVIEINAASPSGPVFDMLGWSPSSFDRADLQVDNQGFGIADPVRHGSGVITRRYRAGIGADAKLFASVEQEIIIQGPVQFGFWFKDVPMRAAGTFGQRTSGTDTAVPKTAIDFNAWLSPEEGYEWRLHRIDEPTSLERFEQGRDRFPFFGVDIEPLRLLSLELQVDSSGKPTSNLPGHVEILARVFLADNVEQPIAGGNLIILAFVTDGTGLHLESIRAVGTPPRLMFAFAASDAGRARRVLLKATPAWTKGALTLSDASVLLSLHGRNVTLNKPQIVCQDQAGGSVEITWTPPNGADGLVKPGEARLRVSRLLIRNSLDPTANLKKTKLILDRTVEICTAHAKEGAPEIVAQFNASPGESTFSLLNSKFADSAMDLREDDHALVFTWSNPTPISSARLLPGLEAGAIAKNGVAVMLAARVGPASPLSSWILPLGAGRCEGEIRAGAGGSSSALQTRQVRWEIDGRRPEKSDAKPLEIVWDGIVAISGVLDQQSAIRWPRLTMSNGGSPGRRRVAPAAGSQPLAHVARYIFADHRLPLSACRPLGGTWTFIQPWTAFVAAHHKLSEVVDGQPADVVLEWTGLESIAIGRALDLIPKLPPDGTIEAVTFAARYRFAFAGAPSKTAEMMIQPGLGAIQAVLQGTLGTAFRNGFWSNAADNTIVAAAGFLGLQMSDRTNRNAEEPLLRLPFLAGLDADAVKPGTFSQSEFPVGGVELAWVDTAAARSLLVRDGHAVAPAGAREADLIAAVRTGALIDNDTTPPNGEIAAALAVEQTFKANPPAETAATAWTNVPYWIGSAVTVSRAIEVYTRDGARKFHPLSLLAGSILRDKRTRGTAALLRGLPEQLLEQPAAAAPPVLISGGVALAVEDWSGGDPENAADSGINGYAAGLAAARHARPLFAVLRFFREGNTQYTTVTLPRAVAADLPNIRQGSHEQTRFAEGARGYSISPASASAPDSVAHWLSPVLEGPVAAVRDEGPGGKGGSGLAGLGRSLKLPAQAGQEVSNLAKEDAQRELVQSLIWFTEKRIPVYLPLHINGMESPPISWLQAASPRVRLPSDSDVAMVLLNSGLGDAARPSPRLAAQSVLPAAMDALTVSERAGIVTARRSFLMGVVPGTDSFDQEQSRFGRAGQAGSSVRRWMRTPRPAQLPGNTGEPDRDRRPEASPLLPQAPLRFLVGPADTVRGTTDNATNVGKSVQWSATMVAAPFSDGVVSDRWDGTVRLAVEIDLAAPPATAAGVALPPDDAAQLLASVLFPSGKDKTQALALGSLKVGDALFRLRWITVSALPGKKWIAHDPAGKVLSNGDSPQPVQEGQRIIWRTRVDLILDPREQKPAVGGGPAGVHAGLAAALSAGSFAVELRLTVHPTETHSSPTPLVPIPIAVGEPVALAITDQAALAVGDDRPPVTLRWTLPAVTAVRGGMPLLPTTLLFVDPAYETGLANPPHEKSVLLDTKDVKGLPANRGAARAVFSADRGRVNRRGSVAFMVDARFERPPEALATPHDGDFKSATAAFVLLLQLIPRARSESIRFLTVAGMAEPLVQFARVYELSLAALIEADGSPAALQAGDVLDLIVTERAPEQISLRMYNSETGGESEDIKLSKKTPPNVPKPAGDQSARGFGLALPLTLTDEPVVEPPSALYAALTFASRQRPQKPPLTGDTTAPTLSLPLYAQSPLPWRVDFRNLKRDFRAGLVRRSATFVWALARTFVEIGSPKSDASVRTHIVKMDRNGQTHLPEKIEELLLPDRIGDT